MTTPNNRLPLTVSIRLAPDERNPTRHTVLIKLDNRRLPFSGVARMAVMDDGLTPEKVIAVNNALAAEFVVALSCPDADLAADVYVTACDILAATRAAERAASFPAGGAP